MHEICNTVAHPAIPKESKVLQLHYFGELTCFEITNNPKCKDLFTKIHNSGYR